MNTSKQISQFTSFSRVMIAVLLLSSDLAGLGTAEAASCSQAPISGAPVQNESGATNYTIGGGADRGFGGPLPDAISLQFYSNQIGAFSLFGTPNNNYATCDQCVLVFQDIDANGNAAKVLFQSDGVLTLQTPPGSPVLNMQLSNVKVIEITFNPVTFVSTPVVGGQCYTDGPAFLFRSGFDTP